MKTFIALFTLAMAFGFNASAEEVTLRCTAGSPQECETRATAALTKLACEPSAASCSYHNEVDGDGKPNGQGIYCDIQTVKCAEAKPYLFGGVYCDNGGTKSSLRFADSKLTLSYSMGIFGWVRSVCVTK